MNIRASRCPRARALRVLVAVAAATAAGAALAGHSRPPPPECGVLRLSAAGPPGAVRDALAMMGGALAAVGRSTAEAAAAPGAAEAARQDSCAPRLHAEVERDAAMVRVNLAGSGVPLRAARSEGPDLASALEGALVASGFRQPPGIPLAAFGRPVACDRDRRPTARALLVGINHFGSDLPGLAGAVRDVNLLDRALHARFKTPEVRRLVDEAATRPAVRAALNGLVAESGCGDLVFFHYSGIGVPSERAARAALEENGGYVQRSDAVALALQGDAFLGESELRGYVTALRNRGALVVLHLDASVSGLRVGAGWSWPPSSGSLTLLPGAAGYATFLAGSHASEVRGKDGSVAGRFTVATVAALASIPTPKVRALAQAIEAAAPGAGSSFEASDPDAVIGPAAGDAQRALDVRLDGEKSSRGIRRLPAAEPGRPVVLSGTVAPADGLWKLLVGGQPVDTDGEGRFKVELELRPGIQKIGAVALYRDFSTAVGSREVEIPVVVAAQPGKRYALVIAIQNYRYWEPLKTPLADGEAVAAVLRQRYGYVTELPGLGSLVLKDADKLTIGRAFTSLRRALGPEDSLIVYFAGHGKAEGRGERKRGYWIPSDGDAEVRGTWYSGQELIGEIADLQARHVLVISDSCFSGDLTRDKPNPPVEVGDAERERLLLERAARRSRILITSGYDEPVLDEGGSGHSVFARALLEGLRRSPADRFLSFDLFSRFIYQQVGGQSRQQPHHLFLVDSGHDGGDLIFERLPGAQ